MNQNHKQLELFSRIDLIGLNGGDGLHYGRPSCFMSNPSPQEIAENDCYFCLHEVECKGLNNEVA